MKVSKCPVIGLVDDHTLFRKGLRELLQKTSKFTEILEFDGANDFKEWQTDQSIEKVPCLLLVDLEMANGNGLELLKFLSTQSIDTKVIILSAHFNSHYIVKLINEGASGFIDKDEDPSELLKAIDMVLELGFYLKPSTYGLLERSGQTLKVSNYKLSVNLSKREVDVLLLICDQFTSKEIADQLYISTRTVEGHRNNLLLKTETRNIAGLVLFAIRNGYYSDLL